MVLFLSYFRTPIIYNSKAIQQSNFLILSYLILFLVSFIGFLNPIWQIRFSIREDDFLISGSISIILWLLLRLIELTTKKPIQINLENIRRHLSLGYPNVSQAKQSADIALLGLKANDYMQIYISDILDHFEDVKSIYPRYTCRTRGGNQLLE